MSKFYHVIVVGAGPAGIMAAITAAKNRKRVLIIDHNDKIAKKIYATGNGRCNFTNEYMEKECFHGDEVLISNMLSQFSLQDCLYFFHGIGILPKSKNGYVYPNSEQASSVAIAFEKELCSLGVDIGLMAGVNGIEKRKNAFYLDIDKEEYRCDKLIIATGLKAAPKLGSDGSFLNIIKDLGHSFQTIMPALCGFYCSGMNFKEMAKVRQEGLLSLYIENEFVVSDFGEIQFTDYGLSGIPMFQLSALASKALAAKKKVEVEINLLPNFDKEEFLTEMHYRALLKGEDTVIGDIWNGLLVDKLCGPFISGTGIEMKVPVVKQKDVFEKLYENICKRRVLVEKPRDYEFAQICTGGIRTEEINKKTLESLFVPGLYFAGELLDVDGICGGYNLQWAFSTGYTAGEFASR